MTAPIERLPVELFDLITSDLDLLAYQQLRLTSRQLHLLSLSTFAKRYFSELTTTLGSSSLDRLVNISSHGYFSNFVTLLDIKLLTHRDYKLLTNIQKVGIFPPPKRFPIVPGIKPEHISGEATLYNDVLSRRFPQCITDRLVCSLQNISNLKTIRFRAHHSEPVGWRSIAMPEGDQIFRTRCFQAVVDAIIDSKIQLEEFSMAKRKKKNGALRKHANVAYPSVQFPFSALPPLKHCFVHLQSLTLAIVAAHNGDSRSPGWENCVSQLIACAPNVKTLALSFDRKGLVSHYSAAVIHSLALSCRLDSLEYLHLVNCSLHEDDLTRFITAHANSIRHVNLAGIRLLSWNWETFWMSLNDIKGLRRVRLAYLEGTSSSVMFRWRDKKRSKFTLDSDKSGRLMCDLLDDLITACRGEENWLPDNFDWLDQ